MRRLILPLVAAVAGLMAGGAAQQHRDKAPLREAANYRDRKMVSLMQEAEKAPAGVTLLIGDSIAERAWVPTMCGRAVFNAGISAARVQDMIEPAKDLAAKIKPDRIIVALGVNDINDWAATSAADFERAYRELLSGLGNRPVTLVAVQPIESGKPISSGMNAAMIGPENVIIRRIASETRATFVNSLRAMPTLDGAHPTVEGGRMWVANIEHSCPAAGTA
jgi:lysophospholipase L1-like esterase